MPDSNQEKTATQSKKETQNSPQLAACMRLALSDTVELLISTDDLALRNADLPGLQAAAAPLLKELVRQGLIADPRTTRGDEPSLESET
ncbi:MAG: hypothetical protein AAF483_12685 [Planctomycetota bacterium]